MSQKMNLRDVVLHEERFIKDNKVSYSVKITKIWIHTRTEYVNSHENRFYSDYYKTEIYKYTKRWYGEKTELMFDNKTLVDSISSNNIVESAKRKLRELMGGQS